MRVGINAAILSSRLTGIGYYVLSLARALARVGRDFEWVFIGVDPAVDGLPTGKNVQILPATGLTGWRRVLWQQFVLPRVAFRAGVQVLHCPDYSRPVRSPIPVVNTIHDLSCYASPPFVPMPKRALKQALTRVAIERSEGLLADSGFTRQEILDRFAIDPERIRIVHLSVDEFPVGRKSKAERPFLLAVGTLEVRKNIVRLVEAFSSLRRRGRIPHRLVLIGQRGWGWRQIGEAIERCFAWQDIETRGYATRDELMELYGSADLLVFPSLYEGFGLPILEAMACGTPVACSRAASMPEVAGDAAEFFDPLDVASIAAAIERVVTSPRRAEELRAQGAARVKQFSWDQCARRHCEAFRAVAHTRAEPWV